MTNGNDNVHPTVTVDGAWNDRALTIRTYLAGLAMQGLCASPDATYRSNPLGSIPTDAVAMADALILALNKDSQLSDTPT